MIFVLNCSLEGGHDWEYFRRFEFRKLALEHFCLKRVSRIFSGVSRNFSREGVWNIFVWTGKFRGVVFFSWKPPWNWRFFLKKGGWPPKPLPEYATGWICYSNTISIPMSRLTICLVFQGTVLYFWHLFSIPWKLFKVKIW